MCELVFFLFFNDISMISMISISSFSSSELPEPERFFILASRHCVYEFTLTDNIEGDYKILPTFRYECNVFDSLWKWQQLRFNPTRGVNGSIF